jgi:hypothetical protein
MTVNELRTHMQNLELMVNNFKYWDTQAKNLGSGFNRKFNNTLRDSEQARQMREFVALCKKIADTN